MAVLWSVVVLSFVHQVVSIGFPDCKNGPLKNNAVCDIDKDPLARATALIDLLTIEEKINNTGSTSPGVPRLGLPDYQWWQEALHGVASGHGVNFSASGDFSYATSFPQPITMGAAFDDDLINAVATVISIEARAFNNAKRAGLDFWTPNINPFRDPRWGRGQETPGEDPYHLASYVHALIDGLQGGYDPKYKRIIATCKHFAGYDMETWAGNYRFQFNAEISTQDMVEFFLPPFQSCARDSNVGAIMCSYGAMRGTPTCADPYLLQTVLREHWGWTKEQQWVVSDCDAVQNIYLPHMHESTREAAAADALNAGCDVNCGTYYQNHLPAAYAQGLINETTVTQALIRQYSSLIRAGYFDPPENQPYRSLGWSDVATPHAQEVAYKAAVEGIVLLKNDGLLPLNIDSYDSIALLGDDWANATTQMQGNYAGIAEFLHGPLYAAQQLNKTINYAAGLGRWRDPTTNNWLPVWDAANKSDIIIFAGGIDNSEEGEGMDRMVIGWQGAQLDMIGQLAMMGKPMIVLQMGAGSMDNSPILQNPNISALMWGGYPGQDGGTALFDLILGKQSPAGRLPYTQYPANYIAQVPMTDMSLRPGPNNPGRTYRWYTGKPIAEFGFGLHYTNFSVSIPSKAIHGSSFDIAQLMRSCNGHHGYGSSSVKYKDQCPFAQIPVHVKNIGDSVTSDYVTLGFLAGSFGPRPYPKKTLVSYQRLHDIAPGDTATATLNITLGSLSRVAENGDRVLYPGEYEMLIDVQPMAKLAFRLTGELVTLDKWPQPPKAKNQTSDGYFVGGWGSTGDIGAVGGEEEVLNI
ncbi:putative xylan 1,4-beta-Xylosidase [Rhizodiscina lignyota]|uniref:xylan 1,4-beta-xylosidase n=1 Tax=Rhizodiscina lignyota TaxID=1504668 RepID=A0A9P4IIR4_9PEZI|nr:putative xylan 1,4-beta-Xylosidase [Rhizodiscina lignyota]